MGRATCGRNCYRTREFKAHAQATYASCACHRGKVVDTVTSTPLLFEVGVCVCCNAHTRFRTCTCTAHDQMSHFIPIDLVVASQWRMGLKLRCARCCSIRAKVESEMKRQKLLRDGTLHATVCVAIRHGTSTEAFEVRCKMDRGACIPSDEVLQVVTRSLTLNRQCRHFVGASPSFAEPSQWVQLFL